MVKTDITCNTGEMTLMMVLQASISIRWMYPPFDLSKTHLVKGYLRNYSFYHYKEMIFLNKNSPLVNTHLASKTFLIEFFYTEYDYNSFFISTNTDGRAIHIQ